MTSLCVRWAIAAGIVVSMTGICRAAEPKVRTGHPRIFVTADTLDALKKKVGAGPAKEAFAKMRGADWIMKEKPGTGYSDITNMAYPAFCYLVTGDKQYLEQAKGYLAAMADKPPADQYQTPEALRAAAMVYDWLYNDLTAAERKRFGGSLVTMADYCAKLWRHADFCNHFTNESLAVLWAAVALAGDGIDDAAATKYLKLGQEHLQAAIAGANEAAGGPANPGPGQPQPDGGQFEGFSYNDWGYARPLAHTFEMWRTATGVDLFATSGFFKTQPAWHAYCLRPDNNTFERAEDCPSGFGPDDDLKFTMTLLAARYGDPGGSLAQWLAGLHQTKFVQKLWMDVLWRDDSVPARSPKELNLPTTKWFHKLGWVAMRSAWDDPDATFALFQCQPFYAGHQHLDANSFVIHRSGSLAIDSGTNDYGTHRGNYYCRSIAHNTMLVFDPKEKFGSAAWSDGGPAGSNDGGQRRVNQLERVGQFRIGSPNDAARILAFKTGVNYVYIAGDARTAYSPDKLTEFTRQFLFLPPGAFVIYDRVTATDETFAKTWVLHAINEPKFSGGIFSIAHGKGTLIGQAVMPIGAKRKAVGGPGKEFLVDGKNYPPEKKVDPEAGAWRIELTPPPGEKAKSQQFLVVLTANGPGQLDIPALDGGGDNAKVEMTMTYQNHKYKLTFPRFGPLGGKLTVMELAGAVREEVNLGGGK